MANFHLFAANGNGKRKFVFRGRQMKNSNRRLVFQQTGPAKNIIQIFLEQNSPTAPAAFSVQHREILVQYREEANVIVKIQAQIPSRILVCIEGVS
jgi:hypothetical protein